MRGKKIADIMPVIIIIIADRPSVRAAHPHSIFIQMCLAIFFGNFFPPRYFSGVSISNASIWIVGCVVEACACHTRPSNSLKKEHEFLLHARIFKKGKQCSVQNARLLKSSWLCNSCQLHLTITYLFDKETGKDRVNKKHVFALFEKSFELVNENTWLL